MVPSLPQNDTAAQQAQRASQIQAAQAALPWSHDSRLAPLGIAANLPSEYNFSPIMLGGAATVVLTLVDDVLTLAAPLMTPSGDRALLPGASDKEQRDAASALQKLRDLRDGLQGHQKRRVAGRAPPPVTAAARGLRALSEAVESLAHGVAAAERGVEAIERGAEALLSNVEARLKKDEGQSPLDMLEDLIKALLADALEALLKEIGLYGPASNLYQYARQFSITIPPQVASTFEDDRFFAWMRLGGPNPMVIAAVTELPKKLPVTDAMYQAVMGADDTLADAISEGRLYLCDYAALTALQPSDYPAGAKTTTAPLALFATPRAGDQALRPVAIQLGQTPGRDNPVLQPGDGAAWELARVYVNCADANHHEMVSHLGRTHLVIEAFAVCTPRQLAPEHPLYVLLTPHFEGTLAINNSAVNTLIAPKGVVDRLLAGTIQSLTQLAIDAALSADLSEMPPPIALAKRGLTNSAALPEFPYRDDALLLWSAIEGWVTEYLSLYYVNDADLAGDTELAAWLAELASPAGGGLKGIPTAPPSFDALVSLVATAIFTASVQHAAVNFPQATIMSFSPAAPLALYTPPPSSRSVAQGALLEALPPLQQGFVQLGFLSLLGGVYFTRLGDYDRYQRTSTFGDPRVEGPLQAFQRALLEVEREIGRRNMRRTAYTTLLPSEIPQSINI